MQWGPGDGSQGGQGGFGGQPQQPQAPQQAWTPPPATPPQQQQPQGPASTGGFHMPPGVHVPSAAEAKGFFASQLEYFSHAFGEVVCLPS